MQAIEKGEEKRSGLDENFVHFMIKSINRLFLHFFCLLIYILPIMMNHDSSSGRPVLDEIHIMDPENRDVNGETTLSTIFTNDYWGRPMNSPSSHKSWRPLSILSFRYLQGGALLSPLVAHRLVNALTHACLADLVGLLAVRLNPLHRNPELLHLCTKLVFALHPTHIEATANAANRPHLLALLVSVLLSDPSFPLVLFPFILVLGFLSCETFIFQTVPVLVTICAIHYVQHERKGGLIWQAFVTIRAMSLRIFVTILVTAVYYGLRYYLDWLSIPEGLIRPAENPFFRLEGWDRMRNYLFVFSVHVFKAWDLDFIGFSHEYGFECIRRIQTWKDPRLYIPLAISVLYILSFILTAPWGRSRFSIAFVLVMVHVSWMVTLFPLTGIVKVGTFVADRLVVASSVGVCILLGSWISSWYGLSPEKSLSRQRKTIALVLVAGLMWHRLHRRASEWMDFPDLLKSSLRTCPRFAKAHLELSKVYSGAYPKLLNLTKSREHLSRAFEIDPDLCDAHTQAYQLAIQDGNYRDFEEHLKEAMLCPYTIGAAKAMWDRYWQLASSNPRPDIVRAAQRRQRHYITIINEVIEKSKDESNEKEGSSPLIGWKRG